jgi:TonB family protein
VAKIARVTGTVVIEAVIDTQGNVVRAQVLSGNPLLVGAALEAVAKWKYEPTLLNGEPIAVEMKVLVDFVIRQ